MLGWLADSFRFAWALVYWNARKSWFRWRHGPVPCQDPSDSGRAYQTGCDACPSWHRPWRFRGVCPLLVTTTAGLRCAVDAADVRPFWGRVVRYYGTALLAVYAAGVLGVFGFLRSIGYPVSIVQVSLPTRWPEIGRARGWFFVSRAERSFARGDTAEGLLYLANAYQFDPDNYDAGLALAKAYQAGAPARSDQIYAHLLGSHSRHRGVIAESWFRALLARGAFHHVATLARGELLRDPEHGGAWLRALLTATRETGDVQPLRTLLASPAPAAVAWRPVIHAELLVASHHRADAVASLQRPWPPASPPYAEVYRVKTLAELGHPVDALDLLEKERARVDDEAWLTMRLDCLADAGAGPMLHREFDAYLLGPTLTQPRLKIMCAQLIRHPDRALFRRLIDKVERDHMPLNDQTAGGWFSLLCTAGAVGDRSELQALSLRLRRASPRPFIALQLVESFFRAGSPNGTVTRFLPYLPVPLEVTYALLDRYPPGTPARTAAASSSS